MSTTLPLAQTELDRPTNKRTSERASKRTNNEGDTRTRTGFAPVHVGRQRWRRQHSIAVHIVQVALVGIKPRGGELAARQHHLIVVQQSLRFRPHAPAPAQGISHTAPHRPTDKQAGVKQRRECTARGGERKRVGLHAATGPTHTAHRRARECGSGSSLVHSVSTSGCAHTAVRPPCPPKPTASIPDQSVEAHRAPRPALLRFTPRCMNAHPTTRSPAHPRNPTADSSWTRSHTVEHAAEGEHGRPLSVHILQRQLRNFPDIRGHLTHTAVR